MGLKDTQIVSAQEFLEYYKQHIWYYNRLARLVSNFLEWQIKHLFKSEHLPVLAKVTYREKSITSLAINLQSKDRYKKGISPKSIDDLAGARFVFYFNDDVLKFCKGQAEPFQRWFGNSSQMQLENKGEFGRKRHGSNPRYRSWHLPVQVCPGTVFYRTLNLVDQMYLLNLRCEVQFRSILQDSWAETEHELSYKARQLNQESKTEIENGFEELADLLDKSDSLLTTVKTYYHPANASAPRKKTKARHSMLQKNWRYEKPVYSNACVIKGVTYGYELLDEPSVNDGRVAIPPCVVPQLTLFDVDKAMRACGTDIKYKQVVWDKLSKKDPQFISRINYDSSVVRVKLWNPENREMEVQLAAYSDQVVTNHKNALMQMVPGSTEKYIRDLALDGRGQLLPFEQSPMSNTIGVSCVIYTADRSWVIGLRSASVAYDPGAWGCSASGALNWIELGHWEDRSFHGWFTKGIIREVEEELGIYPLQDEVSYLGFAREFGRAGKPQVFFVIESHKSSAEIAEIFHTYRKTDSEYQAIDCISSEQARDLVSADDDLVNTVCKDATVSEELRFNLALALNRSTYKDTMGVGIDYGSSL